MQFPNLTADNLLQLRGLHRLAPPGRFAVGMCKTVPIHAQDSAILGRLAMYLVG